MPPTIPIAVRQRAGNTSATSTNSITFTPTLPSSPLAGSLLLVFVAADGTPTVSSMSSGWTKVGQVGSDSVLAVYVAVQGAAGGLAVGTGSLGSEQWATATFEVTGWSGTLSDVTATGAAQSSTAADPPAHTPAGGPRRCLWVVGATSASGADMATAGPPGWQQFAARRSGTGTDAAWVATAEAVSAASVINPPPIPLAASSPWAAVTVSVPIAPARDPGIYQHLLTT